MCFVKTKSFDLISFISSDMYMVLLPLVLHSPLLLLEITSHLVIHLPN